MIDDPLGFQNVSIRDELYQDVLKFLQANVDKLSMRRIRNPSQLVDAAVRCFITCQISLIERRI